MKFLRNEPLKKHTSFRIGGPADYFCAPKSIADLIEAINFAHARQLPIAILGAGTNTLSLDKGFRGMVISLGRGINQMNIRGSTVKVGAGTLLPRLLKYLSRKRLGGLEFLAGIPGTVGGAVVMNAGAWGKSMGEYVLRVKGIDGKGNEKNIAGNKLGFACRKSSLQKGNVVVVEVVLKLRKNKSRSIRKKMELFLKKRRESQPLGIPSAGCIFKNPPGKFAGKLIEEAGCKGMRVGDAAVSCKHANFIVNLGEARARDIIQLMTKMQKALKIKLAPKMKISGLVPEIRLMVKSQL